MIEISWFNGTQQAVYFRIEGAWTWEEYSQALNAFNTMLDSSSQPQIHAVFDYSKGAIFPKNTISIMARQSRKSHAKAGLVIVVGANAFIHSLYHILETVVPQQMEKVRFVHNLAEVPALIGASVA